MYCKPWNAGLASTDKAVAKRIGKLLDAMIDLDANIIQGDILEDIRSKYFDIKEKLEAEGWTISAVNGSLEGTNHMNVYEPGSKTGEKIRKWRKSSC